ncbi:MULTISPECIES: FAD-dependent monooxygenase [unclassified Ensifer]|uniref:FAD-dependent monooxygenase n=1 Tax=unclassified Ensifer TaxID=2633371 RepID=UPI000812C56F|nr:MULTISPECIES: FAD-dependent monooxygenase [unclassified Ensifer]OCP05676.1 FAD-dependent oxidoreductase [Ensifer sp. LC11]OCP06418.1 FAD-dependent oxidoreductase [Ensifer sp. LC13]OCP06856.1 FAD-dependent oxidoreductase [Ensifer sp. LC14]OCP31343.1 FAD-dependent oxidoreductase [Ensifer sp. LC499]
MTEQDVLIVGAGPTGLVLALWLTVQGVKVRIIDKNSAPGPTSRAMVVHARTLELYRQLDLAAAVVAAGHRNPSVNLWAKGRAKARISFSPTGAKLTPYPFVLVYPQDHHERLLAERLEAIGVTVEWQTELVDFEDVGGEVRARHRLPDGSERISTARYLAGCDGARSPVRHKLAVGFKGGTYHQTFYVADVEASGPAANGEVHISLESSDFVALLAHGKGRGRLIGLVRGEREDVDRLSFEDVSHRAIEGLKLTIDKVNWFSTYRVHHRVAEHFRQGRVFLLGDAAHVHSPVGGQGMNTGIGDAINLAWKLTAVLRGRAPDTLLDSYEDERIGFARQLVETTDRLFTFVTAEGRFADFLRVEIAPFLASFAYRIGGIREFLFRILSQTQLNYRGGPLSRGAAGRVEGGDRLPWVLANGLDNHAPLAAISWQVHVYGAASGELRQWCAARHVPLHVFPSTDQHAAAGLAVDAAYLLRPDTYVAVAAAEQAPEAFEAYLAEAGITPS